MMEVNQLATGEVLSLCHVETERILTSTPLAPAPSDAIGQLLRMPKRWILLGDRKNLPADDVTKGKY